MATTLSSSGKSLDPSHFSLVSAKLYNHTGDFRVIDELISNIVIRESIYLPSIIIEVTIADSVNFFESFALIGQETLSIEFEKWPFVSDTPVNRTMEFVITEYSDFAKSHTNANQQAYVLKGISHHAYNSKFMKISRAYNSSASEQIRRIVQNDLFYDSMSIKGTDVSRHKGIINMQEPLSAIEYFRKSAHDENGAPFFFFQSIDNMVRLYSLSYLMDSELNKNYNAYVYLKGYTAAPHTEDDYVERQTRILDFSSNLGMSKVAQSVRGGYASKNNFLDLSNKTFKQKEFDYGGDSGSNVRKTAVSDRGHTLLSQSFKIGRNNSRPLNSLPDAHTEYFSINELAYGTNKNYGNDMRHGAATINAFNSKLNTMTQNITLNGDFNLQAGRKIKLLFPKSMEAIAYRGYNSEDADTGHLDKLLSGNYLITSVLHKFEFNDQEDKYTCDVECKKDSVFSEI